GKCPLKGVQEIRYSVLPHGDRWDRAGVQQESASWNEPLVPVFGQWSEPGESNSLMFVTDPSVEIASFQRGGRDGYVRLFNSAPEAKFFHLIVDGELTQASAVELDGRPIGELKRKRGSREHRCSIELTLRPFGLATVRLHELSGKKDSQP
ncbi:hypothetical protein, partial [Cohnella zeiphila]